MNSMYESIDVSTHITFTLTSSCSCGFLFLVLPHSDRLLLGWGAAEDVDMGSNLWTKLRRKPLQTSPSNLTRLLRHSPPPSLLRETIHPKCFDSCNGHSRPCWRVLGGQSLHPQGIRSLASRNVAADDDNPMLHQWCFPLAWQVHSSIKMWQSAYSLLVFLDTYISSSWCLFGAWQQQVHQWQIPCVSPLSAFVLTKSAFAANIARTRMKRPRFVWSAFSKWFSWCRDAQESFTS